MPKFISELIVKQGPNDCFWTLSSALIYKSDIVGLIVVPVGFETDFASVPRLPLFFALWGDRAHSEAVLHDFLYRIDCLPPATRLEADHVFLEAMKVRLKPHHIRWPMFLGVRFFGRLAYHRRFVEDRLFNAPY